MDAQTMHDEEIRFTVNSFVSQTDKGAIIWNCEDYLPASFLLADELEDNGKDGITHMGTFVHVAPGRRYELEVSEYVELDTGVGSVCPTLSVYDESESLIEKIDVEIQNGQEDEYGFLPLCDAIFKRSGEWLDADFFERYGEKLPFYQQTGITQKQREHPLCWLMEHLMNERRVKDFHRMILDKSLREQLLEEI